MEAWQFDCKYTRGQVEQHNSLEDCWMIIFDKVYNITEFVNEHPGGDYILLECAGRDATQPFLSSRHGSSAYKLLDKYWIGILVDEELYYSNNSSYCSVYSNLSWRAPASGQAGNGPPTMKIGLAGGSEESGGEEEGDDDDLEEESLAGELPGKEVGGDLEEERRPEEFLGGALAWTGQSAARLWRLWAKATRALLRGLPADKSAGASQSQVVRQLALASGCHLL